MAYAHPRYLDANGCLVRQEGSRLWGRGHHFHSLWPSQTPVNNSADETRPRRQRRSRRRPLPDDFYAANTSPRTEPLRPSGEGYMSRNTYSPNRIHGEAEISRPRPAHLRSRPMGFGAINEDQPTAQERHRTSRRRAQRIRPPFDGHERGRTSRRTSYSREASEARRGSHDENEIEYEGVETSMQGPPSVDSPRDLIDEFPTSALYSGPHLTAWEENALQ
ncbi:hypothetical protein Plec18167_002010 [Paecilomyces lecythidis]|uniref:Uncharacterized protein n=1 Tax=Paecilomyces lecythidis TaxID=3004212 RepID=A0ABR3Y986_9EURO